MTDSISSDGAGWPDQPSRPRESGRHYRPTAGGTGWPDQPSSHLEPEPEPVLTDPEALAAAVIKHRGH